eukprot:gene3616-4144_t
MTTIEKEDIKRKYSKKYSNQQASMLAAPSKKYDQGGLLNNIKSVFGNNVMTWLLPVPPQILKHNYQKKGDIFEV